MRCRSSESERQLLQRAKRTNMSFWARSSPFPPPTICKRRLKLIWMRALVPGNTREIMNWLKKKNNNRVFTFACLPARCQTRAIHLTQPLLGGTDTVSSCYAVDARYVTFNGRKTGSTRRRIRVLNWCLGAARMWSIRPSVRSSLGYAASTDPRPSFNGSATPPRCRRRAVGGRWCQVAILYVYVNLRKHVFSVKRDSSPWAWRRHAMGLRRMFWKIQKRPFELSK